MAAPNKRGSRPDHTSQERRAELARSRRRTQSSDRASGRKRERRGDIDPDRVPASPQEDEARNKKGRPPSPFR